MRKALSIVCIFILTISNLYISSYATNPSSTPSAVATTTPTASSKPEPANRKKTFAPSPSPNANQEDEKKEADNKASEKEKADKEDEKVVSTDPEVLSESAILVNNNTGKVLFQKNAHKKMYPASTTKIMTAYLALNHLSLSDEITASKTAVSIASDSSKLGLVAGEILTVEHLLHALLVQSANDAANVLAEAVSGSISEFVALMNQTAQDLGMNNTHFANPHGYHNANHYTTAYDMSLIAAKAMENETFAEIVALQKITIPKTNKHETERVYRTRNNLISYTSSLAHRYQYANGIKTGYTSDAGQCLVGSASRSGMTLISVVFRAPKDDPERAFVDTKNMFYYAYNKYRVRTVQKGDELASTCKVKWASENSTLILKTNSDIKTLLPREDFNESLLTSEITINEKVVAPVKMGDALGEVKYFYDGELLTSAKLFASRDISRSYIKQIFSYIFSLWFLILFGLVVIYIVLCRIKEKKRRLRLRKIRK